MINLLQPLSAFALTSGPGQPESQSFQPAGVSDMVDLFSGDFKYNIPLMDVDGYPLNLNYQSGVGMDDEASWVGLGWNLNVGAISRQLRGVPDDFSGDTIVTTHYTKPKITVGGKLTAKVELKGKAKLGGSFSFGIFSDNYTGIGAELGANVGVSYSFANSGMLTASMGVGVLSNTASGVDVSPNISMSILEETKSKGIGKASLSSSLGYNSRSGLKSLTLGASLSNYRMSRPIVSYNTEPIAPKVQIPYYSEYGSFSFDIGSSAWIVFGGGGATGYRSERRVISRDNINKQYGFLYAEQGKDKSEAVQDFIREKENPIVNEIPNLALPIHTPDIFTYNSQTGSGQFRLYRGGTGAFADNEVKDVSNMSSLGYDIGLGVYAHGGVTVFEQVTANTTRKWTADNRYLKNGDFQSQAKKNPTYDHVFFRKSDEKNIEDQILNKKLKDTMAIAVKISPKTANSSFLTNYLTSNVVAVDSQIVKKQREIRSTSISYLTAREANAGALDSLIQTYNFIDSATFNPSILAYEPPVSTRRNAGIRKAHHISEITVNGQGGERMVYGIPVYNKKQQEYSFAIGGNNRDYTVLKDNLVNLDPGVGTNDYKKGIDHYYHKEDQSAYASSYLLTAVLSPDYVDKTRNGITDDDLGTGMKFKYSKIETYRWRTPYATRGESGNTFHKTATLNRGLLADPDDDKASIIYGEKEIYYVRSIESKNQVAYFITEDRLDGLGVLGWNNDRDLGIQQKRLKEIRLYSKSDLSKPIKVVKFAYSYELCQGTPNSIGAPDGSLNVNGSNNGKLTLKKVWFEYGSSPKGKEHPYEFTYDSNSVRYATMATDRWGSYKNQAANQGLLSNEEFPYTTQNKSVADANAALYHLTKIELPTGGVIDVTYEADDYAYVQNKKAAVMVPVEGMVGGAGASSLKEAKGIGIHLDELPPASVDTDLKRLNWFKDTYLSGSSYMYTKFNVAIGTNNQLSKGLNNDFISTYCKVKGVDVSGSSATIFFELIKESGVTENPIRFSAWQKMKNEYPRYAYPGFMNRVGDGTSSVKAAVTAVANAAKNLTELKENFYVKANRKNYAMNIDLPKSFVRISKTNGYKIGGGVRVQKIKIEDNWQTFTGETDAPRGVYGQSYEYTTNEQGKKISSGVACYEPPVGNDENPLKQPIPYVQKIKGAITDYFELEEPFGESFFPAPGVGYSRVVVKDLNANGDIEPGTPNTGLIVNEYYTARDFPVKVKIIPIQRYNPPGEKTYSLVKTNSMSEMTLSQGYSIELNDMHGKAKAVRILNKGEAEISSTVYHYAGVNPNAAVPKLDNKVNVIDKNGDLKKGVYIGRDIELFTDFREQESKNSGKTINIGVDLIPGIFAFPLPIPHWPVNDNNEYKLFRSACAVKVIENHGIVNKVVKTENGSSIEVENVAYDGVTGEAIVTRTQNEFDKSYYTTNIPAYWAYQKMGGGYQNLGMLLSDISLNGYHEIAAPFNAVLKEGDELIDVINQKKYWVISSARGTGDHALINVQGKLIKSLPPQNTFKVIRSSFRNQLSASAGSIVSLNNPIWDDKLQPVVTTNLSSGLKAINASATLYSDEWPVDGNGQVSKRFENTSRNFNYLKSSIHSSHGANGCRYLSPCDFEDPQPGCDTFTDFQNAFLSRRMDVVGIWLPAPTLNEPVGILTSFYVENSGNYYVGFAGDDRLKITIDNGQIVIPNIYNSFWYWQLYPVYLEKGTHSIELEGYNAGNDADPGFNPGSIAIEIYNNTLSQLQGATSIASLNPIFQTSSLLGYPNMGNLQSFRTIDGVKTWRFTYESYYNPFVHGLKGNWRPYEQKVFQSNRTYDGIFDAGKRGVNLSDAGYINAFIPYWNYNLLKAALIQSANTGNWITANTITLYDKYGQELENKDALQRYSAATFCFSGELPAAVASNAMNREIYVNSFEDSWSLAFNPGQSVYHDFMSGDMKLGDNSNANFSHTGDYSAELPVGGVTLSTVTHDGEYKKSNTYLERSADGEYSLIATSGLSPKGFEPRPGKQYLFSAWIKDDQATDRSVNITLSKKEENQAAQSIQLTCKAIVEGWKLIEGPIVLSGNKGSLSLSLFPNFYGIRIDDIRIHPYEAQLKSYAYSSKTFKLMAELDENAFATFYEYDDKGSLTRVKKETERGIITIKESRSSYRKKI
ncbi:hypothetical protein FBD94_25200 [Pedobacter hiemivivus]|uniref:PA14 domain-containing protein n=1 Tax=Pedobacter hiemivivus TaxID=2530454 RepID=A0A4U1FWR9_9SPHI|nr:hypothetical protein [Pedobacter hiemivivus]TKC55288.1 hypothetical protein FBD94_25200 [Pedobacter hiemivivus]